MNKVIAASLLTAVLLPTAHALAQNSTNNAGGVGSNVATPERPTAASNPALTTGTISKEDKSQVPARKNPNVGGATGRTVVPGNNSTVAGSTESSTQQKTGTGK